MLIVADSGPILSFARAGQLAVLQSVVVELVIPEGVHEEVVVRGAGRPGATAIAGAAWIVCQTLSDRSLVVELSQKLHIGEREAIALSVEVGGALLVDEREARREADRLGIQHFGSLRVIKEAKVRKAIREARPILDGLISTGTFLSKPLYNEFLRQVGEE